MQWPKKDRVFVVSGFIYLFKVKPFDIRIHTALFRHLSESKCKVKCIIFARCMRESFSPSTFSTIWPDPASLWTQSSDSFCPWAQTVSHLLKPLCVCQPKTCRGPQKSGHLCWQYFGCNFMHAYLIQTPCGDMVKVISKRSNQQDSRCQWNTRHRSSLRLCTKFLSPAEEK